MASRGKCAKTHEENRHSICLMCKKKPNKKFFKTTGKINDEIKKIFSDFNNKDSRLPAVVCDSCRLKITRTSANTSSKALLQMPDYSQYCFKVKTRNGSIDSGNICECTLCTEVRSRKGQFNVIKRNPKSSKPLKTNNRCSKCCNVIAKGIMHKCNKTTFLKNVEEVVETSKQAEHLVSGLLKNMIMKNNGKAETTNAAVSLSQGRGKPLKININEKEKKQARQISADNLRELQNDLNLSDNKVKAISKFLRKKKTNLQGIIEPNAREINSQKSHNLDHIFELYSFDFVIIKNDKVTNDSKFAVVCNNLIEFIHYVTDSRNIFDFHLNFGIDGGGGSLKFTLSIQAKNEHQKTSKNAEKWKDTGVKKIFIIALAPNTQENYTNVKFLWSKLAINKCFAEYSATITTDLKLANIIAGLTGNTSTHPCILCDVTKNNLHSCGTLRTSAKCLSNYNNWCNNGSIKIKAKNFQNCIHPPLFYAGIDQLILDVMPPPELHLLLGCVNKLYSHMLILYPNIATKWAQQCHVERNYANGGNFSFEGNACKSLLKNVDKLQTICELDPGGLAGCMDYVDTFKKFEIVVHDCFSHDLRANFEHHIEEFKRSYEVLGISVTPKVHTIFYHVAQFCSKHRKGLGFFGEQATESVHHDFNENWKNYKVSKLSENFWPHLLRAVCYYNSGHL